MVCPASHPFFRRYSADTPTDASADISAVTFPPLVLGNLIFVSRIAEAVKLRRFIRCLVNISVLGDER